MRKGKLSNTFSALREGLLLRSRTCKWNSRSLLFFAVLRRSRARTSRRVPGSGSHRLTAPLPRDAEPQLRSSRRKKQIHFFFSSRALSSSALFWPSRIACESRSRCPVQCDAWCLCSWRFIPRRPCPMRSSRSSKNKRRREGEKACRARRHLASSPAS